MQRRAFLKSIAVGAAAWLMAACSTAPLHSRGRLLRDGRTGRSYTWNAIGTAVPGPMSPVFLGRAQDMMVYFEDEIERRGAFNRGLANAYRRGATDSCYEKRQWTDTLTKTRNRLRNCLTVKVKARLAAEKAAIRLRVPNVEPVPGSLGVIGSDRRRSQHTRYERIRGFAADNPVWNEPSLFLKHHDSRTGFVSKDPIDQKRGMRRNKFVENFLELAHLHTLRLHP